MLKSWMPLKLGKKSPFFKYLIFWKILLAQHYTCWILLDFDLHLVYFIMQNCQVTREWDEADWQDPLIYSLFESVSKVIS